MQAQWAPRQWYHGLKNGPRHEIAIFRQRLQIFSSEFQQAARKFIFCSKIFLENEDFSAPDFPFFRTEIFRQKEYFPTIF